MLFTQVLYIIIYIYIYIYKISHVYNNHLYIENININAFPRAHDLELCRDDEKAVMQFFFSHYAYRVALGLSVCDSSTCKEAFWQARSS